MNRTGKFLVSAALLLFSAASNVFADGSIAVQRPALVARYDAPATVWESEALPIGNGYMGALIFGGVQVDKIQVNEKTLWSGGPGEDPAYNGGHRNTPAINRQHFRALQNILQQRMTDFSNHQAAHFNPDGTLVTHDYPGMEGTGIETLLDHLKGTKEHFGSYQTLGCIEIEQLSADHLSQAPEVTSYLRSLDIDNALHTVTYTQDGVNYTREYFMSYPDKVLVVRLSADRNGKISRAFELSSPHINQTINAVGNVITLTGQPSNHRSHGLKFAQQLKIRNTGGTISTVGNKIRVENADEVLLLMSAATNYVQSTDERFNYFSDTDPLAKVRQTLAQAETKTCAQLLATHRQDYQSLYNRMEMNLGSGSAVPSKTTDRLLADFYTTNTAAENRYAELLYYQFGRYLLIACSRENTLPANLQGVWAEGLANPWNADYHTNINIQMNYWLAQQTNLRECHTPVIEYINSLVPRGRITANAYHCKADGSDVRGWVTYHENNIWGNTAPAVSSAFYFPAANGWLCQDIWEYYRFNSDTVFLQNNYNTLLEAALFWVDNLWRDTRDGRLVANPSYSPEHGEYSLGCASDQGIICELFDMVIKASEVLNCRTPEIAEIEAAQRELSGPQIGLNGQFMEWKDEVTRDLTGDGGHRHANHLFWLHPGSQIVAGRSLQEDRYVEGMKKALHTRGDGGTGWSKAWKVNFWARLHDGNRAHKLLKEAMTLTYSGNPSGIGGVYPNLFDTHPPFQIDGNFGVTAGVTEMLVQSQGGYIELLPALPSEWHEGVFKGIKARGNFELSVQWADGRISQAEITSLSGNDCIVKYPDITDYRIVRQDGAPVAATVIGNDRVSFSTVPGGVYKIRK